LDVMVRWMGEDDGSAGVAMVFPALSCTHARAHACERARGYQPGPRRLAPVERRWRERESRRALGGCVGRHARADAASG
jgi:hypothetical protein